MDKLPPRRGKRVLQAAAYRELSQPSTQSKPRRRSLFGDSVVLGLAEPDDHLSTTPTGPAPEPTPATHPLGQPGRPTVAISYLHAHRGSRAMCSSTFPEVVGYLQSHVTWSRAARASQCLGCVAAVGKGDLPQPAVDEPDALTSANLACQRRVGRADAPHSAHLETGRPGAPAIPPLTPPQSYTR
jgi:hypothetical protein